MQDLEMEFQLPITLQCGVASVYALSGHVCTGR